MNSNILNLIKTIQERNNHVLVVSGNIYDTVALGKQTFLDTATFIESLTINKFPNFLRYDIFSGMTAVRGDELVIASAMGISKSSQNQDPLVQALRNTGVVRESPFPVNPLEVFLCLDRLFAGEIEPTLAIIEYADSVVGGNTGSHLNRKEDKVFSVALTKWARNIAIRQKGHLIILLCQKPETLDSDIMDRIHETAHIRIPKPDFDSRKQFLVGAGVSEAEVISMSTATSGLALKELNKIKKLSVEEIFAFKKRILSDEYGDILEVMDTRHDFLTIGGLEKQIQKLQRIALYIREGRVILVPQGIMFMGPPGTGKTLLAEAFAKESKLNFVKPRDIKSMWVGKSEERMTAFLSALKDLAPVVCFIDEVDQNQIQRGSFDGDSGVSKNLFKKILECMSDPALRGKVLWIMATNRPDLIDPAMKRPGRCDLRIPFLPADERQLALICEAAFNQFPDMKTKIIDWSLYAKKASGYTGADMIEVVRRAWEHACEETRQEIFPEDMEWALIDYKPQVYDRGETLRMSLLALVECSSQSLLPDNWEETSQKMQKELFGGNGSLNKNPIFSKDLFLGPLDSARKVN